MESWHTGELQVSIFLCSSGDRLGVRKTTQGNIDLRKTEVCPFGFGWETEEQVRKQSYRNIKTSRTYGRPNYQHNDNNKLVENISL